VQLCSKRLPDNECLLRYCASAAQISVGVSAWQCQALLVSMAQQLHHVVRLFRHTTTHEAKRAEQCILEMRARHATPCGMAQHDVHLDHPFPAGIQRCKYCISSTSSVLGLGSAMLAGKSAGPA